jgi:O-antigen/teichoic acid export membrane protein
MGMNAQAKIRRSAQTMAYGSKGGRLLRAIGSYFAADLLGVLGVALFSILLGRLRGAEELGVFSFAMALGTLAQVFTDANYQLTLPQQVARTGELTALTEAQAAKLVLWLPAFAAVLAVAAASGQPQVVFVTAVALFAGLLHSVGDTLMAGLRGAGQQERAARIIAVSSTIGASAAVAGLFAQMPLALLVLLNGVATALPRVAWGAQALHSVHPEWNPWLELQRLWRLRPSGAVELLQRLGALLRERFGWMAFGFLTVLFMRYGVLLLGWVGTPAAVGVYSAAQRFLMVLRMLPGAVLVVLLPEFARNPDRASLRQGIALSLLVAAAVVLPLWIAAPVLMELTFAIEEAVLPLRLMLLSFPAVLLSHLLEAYVLALPGTQHRLVRAMVLILLAMLPVTLLGYAVGGVPAVALAYTVMEVLYMGAVAWSAWSGR